MKDGEHMLCVVEVVESGVDFFKRVIIAVWVIFKFWRGRGFRVTDMVG